GLAETLVRQAATISLFHEPQKVGQAPCLFATDRLEACPTLHSVPRFTLPMHAQKRKGTSHEPPPHPVPLPLRGGEGARRAGEGAVSWSQRVRKKERGLPMTFRERAVPSSPAR